MTVEPINLSAILQIIIHNFVHKSDGDCAYIISPPSMEVRNRRETFTHVLTCPMTSLCHDDNQHIEVTRVSQNRFARLRLLATNRKKNSPWWLSSQWFTSGYWLLVGYSVLNNMSRWVIVDDTDACITYTGQWFLGQDTQNNLGNFGPPYLSTCMGQILTPAFHTRSMVSVPLQSLL